MRASSKDDERFRNEEHETVRGLILSQHVSPFECIRVCNERLSHTTDRTGTNKRSNIEANHKQSLLSLVHVGKLAVFGKDLRRQCRQKQILAEIPGYEQACGVTLDSKLALKYIQGL